MASAGPLKNPHWIIDVTRPQNECGGCKQITMNSITSAQMTWRTSDESPWWMRSTTYSEPSGDYKANCYMRLPYSTPVSESAITFNDANCNYHSNAYFLNIRTSVVGLCFAVSLPLPFAQAGGIHILSACLSCAHGAPLGQLRPDLSVPAR